MPVLAPTQVRLVEEARRARGEPDGDGRKRELGRERDGESECVAGADYGDE